MQFDVKAWHPVDGVMRIACTAADEGAARRKMAAQGYTMLSLRPTRLRGVGGRFKVSLFGQELMALMEAGLGLIESISILAAKARDPEARDVLGRILQLLNEGQTLSAALAAAPERFPVLFVATVRSSEQTGGLNQALRRYLDYQRQLDAVRARVVSASIYPALLLAVGGLVILFLLVYVVPRFGRVYADLGRQDVPFLSRVLIEWGALVGAHGGKLLLGICAVLAALSWLATRVRVRAALQRWLWRLPRLGRQLRTYQLARFTRTVAMLVRGGVPLVAALDMTGSLLRQPALRAGLAAARSAISEGAPLADTFRLHGLATDIGVRLLVVGERAGNLGETMEKIAAFYDEEVAREVDWFSKSFEPLLMALIGLLIGAIVILMYLPIFDLAGSLG